MPRVATRYAPGAGLRFIHSVELSLPILIPHFCPPNPFTVSLLYSSSAAVFSSLRLLSSQLVDPPFSYLLYPPLKALAHLHKFVRGCSLSVFTFRWGADLKG